VDLHSTFPLDGLQDELFSDGEAESRRNTLADQGDSQTPLLGLIDDLMDGTLLSPPHQRDFVWDAGRRKAWVERLVSGSSRAVGCIVTYQIKNGRPSPTFINDGWQRLSTTREFLVSPDKYGMSAKEAREVVKNYKVTVQHRHYVSQEDALADFQGLNLGTSLTPFEFYYGTLATMPHYKVVWEPLITQLHEGIDAQARISGRVKGRQKHKYLRHDYALFHYILTGSNSLSDYPRIASADVKVVNGKHEIEVRLRQALLTVGPDKASTELQRLIGIVRDDTALIETEWIKVRPSPEKLISNSTWRFLLHIGLWRRANSLPVGTWHNFITEFLSQGKGQSAVASSDGKDRVTVGMTSPSSLGSLCQILGSDLMAGRPPRAKRPPNIREGYDASHIQPFLTNGNGPMVPEPASLNRSRGAMPMVLDEA
jgi:hypothetical protein